MEDSYDWQDYICDPLQDNPPIKLPPMDIQPLNLTPITTSDPLNKRQHSKLYNIVMEELNNPASASSLKWFNVGKNFQINWEQFVKVYRIRGKSLISVINLKNCFTRKNHGFKKDESVMPDPGYDTVFYHVDWKEREEEPPLKRQRLSKNTEQPSSLMPPTPSTPPTSFPLHDQFQPQQLVQSPQQTQPLAQFLQIAEPTSLIQPLLHQQLADPALSQMLLLIQQLLQPQIAEPTSLIQPLLHQQLADPAFLNLLQQVQQQQVQQQILQQQIQQQQVPQQQVQQQQVQQLVQQLVQQHQFQQQQVPQQQVQQQVPQQQFQQQQVSQQQVPQQQFQQQQVPQQQFPQQQFQQQQVPQQQFQQQQVPQQQVPQQQVPQQQKFQQTVPQSILQKSQQDEIELRNLIKDENAVNFLLNPFNMILDDSFFIKEFLQRMSLDFPMTLSDFNNISILMASESSSQQNVSITLEQFNNFLLRFGPLTKTLDKIRDFVNAGAVNWFHGNITREKAVELLKSSFNKEKCTHFLLRSVPIQTTASNFYVFAVSYINANEDVIHIRTFTDKQGRFCVPIIHNAIEGTVQKFEALKDFKSYLKKNLKLEPSSFCKPVPCSDFAGLRSEEFLSDDDIKNGYVLS